MLQVLLLVVLGAAAGLSERYGRGKPPVSSYAPPEPLASGPVSSASASPKVGDTRSEPPGSGGSPDTDQGRYVYWADLHRDCTFFPWFWRNLNLYLWSVVSATVSVTPWEAFCHQDMFMVTARLRSGQIRSHLGFMSINKKVVVIRFSLNPEIRYYNFVLSFNVQNKVKYACYLLLLPV